MPSQRCTSSASSFSGTGNSVPGVAGQVNIWMPHSYRHTRQLGARGVLPMAPADTLDVWDEERQAHCLESAVRYPRQVPWSASPCAGTYCLHHRRERCRAVSGSMRTSVRRGSLVLRPEDRIKKPGTPKEYPLAARLSWTRPGTFRHPSQNVGLIWTALPIRRGRIVGANGSARRFLRPSAPVRRLAFFPGGSVAQ